MQTQISSNEVERGGANLSEFTRLQTKAVHSSVRVHWGLCARVPVLLCAWVLAPGRLGDGQVQNESWNLCTCAS